MFLGVLGIVIIVCMTSFSYLEIIGCKGRTYVIIMLRDLVDAEFHIADDGGNDGTQLEVCELRKRVVNTKPEQT
jgi:hypothetical protein